MLINHTILPSIVLFFDTNNPVISLIHHHEYDSTISIIESQIVVSLIMEYYRIIAPQNEMDFNDFWATKLGIVVPHNAQSNLIIQKIYAFLEKEIDYISNNELRNIISKSITSVEKFQGSARDLIICSIAISSKDQLRAEEEFIYDLNRYNVISSRAKKKFFFISSKNYLDFLPNDQNLMDNISIVRNITYKYLTHSSTIDLECEEHGFEKIDIRWKPFPLITVELNISFLTQK